MESIQVMPCFSLEPNKLVSFNRVFKNSDYNADGTKKPRTKLLRFSKNVDATASNSIERSSHHLTISDNAYRTLKRRINWLYYLAKARHVKTYSGKDIFNFKIAFLTLTLPSVQRAPTSEITATLFNQFMTELRQRVKMSNYIWRLEFQKNGNVHYHVISDTYVDYFLALKIWNRILDAHGYVKPYTDKMQNMTLSEYVSKYQTSDKVSYQDLARRYAKGRQSGWKQPPTIDIKSVMSKKAIANYISKYFAKDASHGTIKNALDDDANTKNMRLWFCSRSLSKLQSVSDFCEAVHYDIFSLVGNCRRIKKLFFRYATVIYYDLLQFAHESRKEVEMLLKNYSIKQGYIPAI